MSTNTGGPAFPSHGSMGEVAHQGMTLRDYFAGQALIAIISSTRTAEGLPRVAIISSTRTAEGLPRVGWETAAAEAVQYADAMLAALEAKQ